jgi:hypothetical protein
MRVKEKCFLGPGTAFCEGSKPVLNLENFNWKVRKNLLLRFNLVHLYQ